MVTLCIVVVPHILFLLGSAGTSGLNTFLLLLLEVIFALAFTPLTGEKTTPGKLAGAMGILVGAVLTLCNGESRLDAGDILIIASTTTHPIGNFYTKKALFSVSPSKVLPVRFSPGGLFMLLPAMLFESHCAAAAAAQWPLILLTGLVALGAGKIVWYEAPGRLDASKAVSLSMTFPLFGLVALVGVLGEKVAGYQWIGIAMMMVGVYFSVKRRSTDPKMTRCNGT